MTERERAGEKERVGDANNERMRECEKEKERDSV